MAGVTDPALYEQKLANLASMISTYRPDVIGLQEICNPGALDDLKNKQGPRYPHVLVATHFDAMHPIRVAALLRRGVRPVDDEELIEFPTGALPDVPQADKPLKAMGRGALAFSATIGGESFRFVVAHLKSKLLEYPGDRFQPKDENGRARAGGFALLRRAAEAVAVRVWANEWLQAHPGRPLIVVGDANDGPDAATTQILYGPPDQNLNRPDKGDPWRPVNLARFLPSPDTAFSRIYKHRGELIDHILASTDLARCNVEVLVDTTNVRRSATNRRSANARSGQTTHPLFPRSPRQDGAVAPWGAASGSRRRVVAPAETLRAEVPGLRGWPPLGNSGSIRSTVC